MWANILLWAIVVVYIGLILSTVTVVLLENRQPAKTIAWTIVLVMLPIVGFIIFYFFGQNIRKERYISRRQYSLLTQRMMADVADIATTEAPPRYAPLVQIF